MPKSTTVSRSREQALTPRRVAANRQNAARSTGPRTPEGKARSAQNARKHGFTAARFAVIRLEELDAVARLRDDLIAVYQPVNSQELFAVERIAIAQQALLRCATLEAGLFSSIMDEAYSRHEILSNLPVVELTHGIEVAQAQNRAYALAEGLQWNIRKSAGFSLFLRYQVQVERLYRRAVEEFERLRALRDILPNEPISDVQPQETTPVSSPKTNPDGACPPAPDPQETPASPAAHPAPPGQNPSVAAAPPGRPRTRVRQPG